MYDALLKKLELSALNPGACTGPDGWLPDPHGQQLDSYNPSTGERIGSVVQATHATYDRVVEGAQQAFQCWRMTSAPKRGLVVRDLAMALRELCEPLGELVTLEM